MTEECGFLQRHFLASSGSVPRSNRLDLTTAPIWMSAKPRLQHVMNFCQLWPSGKKYRHSGLILNRLNLSECSRCHMRRNSNALFRYWIQAYPSPAQYITSTMHKNRDEAQYHIILIGHRCSFHSGGHVQGDKC